MTTIEERNPQHLAQRLAEAEATIAALLSGQIDAVVDSKNQTPVLLAKAQDALRESEALLRFERDLAQQYLDTAQVILLKLDTEGRVALVNRYACSVLGWTADELLGRDWVETCIPTRIRGEMGQKHRNLLNGDLSVVENPILTMSGEERLVEWRNTMLRDDEGCVTGTLSSGTDITERHRVSEALRISEERSRFALASAGIGIWDLDCATGEVRWSEILEIQHGMEPGTFAGTFKAFLGGIHADDREPVNQTLGKSMQSGTDFSILYRTIWPDGELRWLLGEGRFLLGKTGKPVRGVGICQDVTERVNADAALRVSTADLVERTKLLEEQTTVLSEQAELLDLAPDAIVVRDMQGRVVYWNRGAEVLYGWLRKEALERDIRELLQTDFSRAIETEFLRQGHWEGEALHYTRDGAQLIVASRWTMQRDADGAPIRILTISNDITARKQAVQALDELSQRTQRRERILTTTLSFISDFAYIFDRDGRFLFVNQPLLDLWGITLEDAVGKNFFELGYPDDLAERLQREVQEVIGTKKSLTGETPYTNPNGIPGYYEYILSPVSEADGTVEFVAGCTRDITERKQAEGELRTAKDAAEAGNKAKSEFLANMSHEIRTPMNGVIGMTDLVLDTDLTEDQRDDLEIVKSSAAALMAIISDILDFSRIEAHRLELHPINFNPRDTIGNTAKAMALRAQQKGLKLIVDVEPNVPEMLTGDPGRLRQILVNLLGNAIKFTDQGEVVLRVTSEAMTPQDEIALLHFSVRDTGIGIPQDHQESIFDAFTQADGSMTRAYGGTGLGLTISLQLVQLMGGRIWVESEAGQGSTFHFTAHLAEVKSHATTAEIPNGLDLRGLPVLVVDDNATSQRLLKRLLIGWRMVPTLAASVSEALAVLRMAQESGQAFPLVLTDFQLPDADGFALAETIRKDPTLARPSVVMLTSAGHVGDAARCRESGIAAYLPKPIQQGELQGAIQLALGARVRSDTAVLPRHFLPESPHTGRILVVEDNMVNQLVAKRLLEKRGHTVILANNGREALAILNDASTAEFDCVLMDVQMPEVDGFECTAIIREREQTTRSHLPIIAMTAHTMEGDDVRCLAAGMDAYLSKPLEPGSFLHMVERHLRIANGRAHQ